MDAMRIKVFLRSMLLLLAASTTASLLALPNDTTTRNVVNPTEAADRNLVCSDVAQLFVMKQIGTADMVPMSPINGEDLEVCKSQTSCCTKGMEKKYEETVKKDFLNIVHATCSPVKNSIATNLAKLQGNFVDMISISHNNTNVLFAEVYHRMHSEAQEPVNRLYSDLSSYMQGQETIDLEESVGSFFDALFPLVYQHNINPKMHELSHDYKECMQETQDELRPFGEVARRLANHVAKSFRAARALVQGLTVGDQAMNLTSHVLVSVECERALLRLTYCPHCRGVLAARPCSGYCLNVVRGCLASVAEMEQPWNDFISAMDRLVAGMRGAFSVEEVLSVMDAKISEAIMHAMENGPDISKKVKRVCGQPKRATRDTGAEEEPLSSLVTTDGPDKVVPVRSSNSATLYNRLQNLMRILSPSKNFFSGLADTLCSDDNLAMRSSQTNCWNGQGIGEYTKTIVGFDLSAQKHNPEMEVTQAMDQKIAQLVDRLKHVRQIIAARASLMPESDSMVNDGSGSGYKRKDHPYNNYGDYGDDEDDDEDGSGSGDGDQDSYQTRTQEGGNRNKPSRTGDEDIKFDDPHGFSTKKEGKKANEIDNAHPTTGNAASSLPNLLVIFAIATYLATKNAC